MEDQDAILIKNLKQIFKDENQVKDLVRIFVTTVPENLEKMESGFLNGEKKVLRSVAHSLKPSIVMTGDEQLISALTEVHQFARGKKEMSNESVREKIAEMKQRLAVIINELNRSPYMDS